MLSSKMRSDQLQLRFELYLIHKAPHPVFAGFDGLHDGMFGRVEMFRCVLVLGRIATPNVAALAAKPQVHPIIAHFQTFFASLCVWAHILNVAGVRTSWAHAPSFVAS
jgi:hypothetical protein